MASIEAKVRVKAEDGLIKVKGKERGVENSEDQAIVLGKKAFSDVFMARLHIRRS